MAQHDAGLPAADAAAAALFSDVLTPAGLSALLGAPVARVTLVSARALEQSAVAAVDADGAPLLLKRASVAHLRAAFPHKADEAFDISARSFAAEVAWARAAPTAALSAAGARVPAARGAAAAGGVFTTAQERLEGDEVRRFDAPRARQALHWLASFHAFFFADAAARDALVAAGAFAAGGGWSRAAQRPAVDYAAGAGAAFRALLAALPEEAAAAGVGGARDAALVDALGARARARHAAAAAAPPACGAGTLVHGDYKAANVLFLRDGGIAAFDFQWASSAPSGASDVAYLLAGAVAYDDVAGGGAGALVDAYADALRAALVARGVGAAAAAAAADRAALRAAVDEELVLFFATALPYLWRGTFSREVARENEARPGFLTCEDDPRVAMWLAARALAVLRREAGEGAAA
jgi:hypothetical protein